MISLKYLKINISYLQIHNYYSERFLKTTECTKIKTDESTKINTPEHFVNTESKIDTTKFVPVDQKA